MTINGKEIARRILDGLRREPKPAKFLAGVLVGDDPASESFQKLKQRTAQALGWDYRIYKFPAHLSKDELRREVGRIGGMKPCGGVIVQLPLPGDIDKQYVLNAIPPEKDPDVLSERSLGAFYAGRNTVLQPAAGTVDAILRETGFELKDKIVAVVGPGFLVGRPVAAWLMGKTREVRVLHRGFDTASLADADLVISGAGRAGLLRADALKKGAGVIDFGYSEDEAEGRLVGDLDRSGDLSKLAFHTPTPGGTGPVLVAKLFENFHALQKKNEGS